MSTSQPRRAKTTAASTAGSFADKPQSAPEAVLEPPRKLVPVADIQPQMLVWDGEEAFTVSQVSRVTGGYILHSARGDFWQLSPERSVNVFRDAQALEEHLEASGY